MKKNTMFIRERSLIIIFNVEVKLNMVYLKKVLSYTLVGIITSSAISTTVFANEISEQATPSRVLEFIVDAPSYAERDTMWIDDLQQFREAVIQRHGKFHDNATVWLYSDLFEDGVAQFGVWIDLKINEVRRQNFINVIDELISDVSNLTDMQIVFGMQRAASQLQDGHFHVLPEEAYVFILPIDIKPFGDGFYVISTVEEFAHILNHRVQYINDIPMHDIKDLFADLLPFENSYALRNLIAMHSGISFMHSLEYLGLFEDYQATFIFYGENGHINVTFTIDDIIYDIEVDYNSNPIFELQARTEGYLPKVYQEGGNRFYFLEDYGILYVIITGYSPYALNRFYEILEEREPDSDEEHMTLWQEILELIESGELELDGGVLSPILSGEVPIWKIDSNEEGITAFTPHTGILQIIEDNEIQAVVIDGRYNPGGNHTPFRSLFHTLAEATPEGMAFYFINNASFSAGSMAPVFASYLGFTIIGEPVSENLIFYGVYTMEDEEDPIYPNVILNNSGIPIRIPNILAHIHSEDFGIPMFGSENAINNFIKDNPSLQWYTVVS